jgi:hypothetical protein
MQTSFKEPLVRVETLSTTFIVLIGIPFAPQGRDEDLRHVRHEHLQQTI